MSGYGLFARYYDALTANVDYAARAEFFDTLIRRYQRNTGLILDLACGTGNLSIALAKLGHEVIAADASAEMLTVALQKIQQSPHKILFLHQDMDELDLYGTVDATICALDSINHIPEENELLRAFQKVSMFTNPGGLFLFDVNTAYKHREILGNNTFIYDLENLFCCWQNEYHAARDRVDISLDFFERQDDARYTRESERFSEWIYPDATLKKLLEQAGFRILQTLEGDTFFPVSPTADRLVYVAKKS